MAVFTFLSRSVHAIMGAMLTFVGLTDFMETWLDKFGYDWLEAAVIRDRLQETTCWVVRLPIY